MGPSWALLGPKDGPKRPKHGPKIGPRWLLGPKMAHLGPSLGFAGGSGILTKTVPSASWAKREVQTTARKRAVFWTSRLGHLGAILRPLGASEGDLGAILGPLWAILGQSWGHLGAILGPYWGHLGAIVGHLGAILGPSWGHLGAILRPSWGILGSSWGHLKTGKKRKARILLKMPKVFRIATNLGNEEPA